ncbi:DUF456 domain-containing protein [Virgibacillus sp. W0430]|uniref:DUF456 domain-containing protein n=1 Tax=Virgibacillus sp. W0430 TaxID=3391580 RepID=UPI003F463F65
MLEGIVWIIIILLFILSFVGVIFPLIPSVFVLWIGFLLYHFLVDNEQLTVIFWLVMGLWSIILVAADIIANSYFVKKFGGSKWGERGAVIAVIVGSFLFPPFGILIVPFITVFIIEMIQQQTVKEALLAAIGSLIAFLSGAFAKVVIQLIMIIWFIVVVLI